MLLYISKRTNNLISQILIKYRVFHMVLKQSFHIDDDAIKDDKSERHNLIHHFAGEAGTDELGHCAGDGFAEKSAS